MTTTNRQQSLEAARRAAHFLKLYIQTEIVDEVLRAEIACLVDEFERLDENASRAGRKRIANPKPATLSQRRWRDKQKNGEKK